MNNTAPDNWNPGFLSEHPMFWPLATFADDFVSQHHDWPGLNNYQQFFEQGSGLQYSANNKPLRFVTQGKKPETLDQAYEPRIYLKGEIQTRLQNWHDFFQVLVWRIFPNTKILLNQRHYSAIVSRQSHKNSDNCHIDQNRSAMENLLTQFDECGGIILSTNPDLLALVRDFRWNSLFLDNRHLLDQQLKCIVFGHALYEKGLTPYIGMTAHCLLLHTDETTFNKSTKDLLPIVDNLAQETLSDEFKFNHPRDLHPFPLLGMPGWHPENISPGFYQNLQYFRPGRKK